MLVLLSGLPLFSGPVVINNASSRYAPANTQTQASTNDCDTSTNCAINSPQTRGDGSDSSPTNLQITGVGEQGAPASPPPEPKTSILHASVKVICAAGAISSGFV